MVEFEEVFDFDIGVFCVCVVMVKGCIECGFFLVFILCDFEIGLGVVWVLFVLVYCDLGLVM